MIYGETAGSAKFKPNFKSENVTKLSRGTSIKPKSKAKIKLKDTDKIKIKIKKPKAESKVAPTVDSSPNAASGSDSIKPKKSSRLTSITLKIPPVDPKFVAKEYAKIANIDDTPMTDEEAKDIGLYLAKILSSSDRKVPSLKLGKLKTKKKALANLDLDSELETYPDSSSIVKSKSKPKLKLKKKVKESTKEAKAEMPMPFKKVKTKSDEKKALPLSERLLLIRERLRAKKAQAAEVETVVKPKKSRLATFAGDSDHEAGAKSRSPKSGKKKVKSKQKNNEFESAKAAELKEIEEIKEQLRRKLEATAFEEGVEMVFDVDAALKPLEDEVLAANPETLKATAAKLNPALDYTQESPLHPTSSKSEVKKKSKLKRKKKPASYEEVLLNTKAVDYDDDTIVPAPRPRRTFRDDEEYVEITAPDPYSSLSPKARLIAERKLGSQHTPGKVKHTGKIDPEALASNVVDIPQSEVESFRAATKKLTRKYIDFMRSDILPHLIALDSAIDYTKALMADGLSREDITTDDSLLITLRWMLHRKATDFFGSVLGCKMDGEAFDQTISQLYKSDLMKTTSYITDTVGIIRGDKAKVKRSKRRTNSLGVVSPKQ